MNRGYSTLAKAAAPLRIIVSSSNNPFYNLSFESFLLQSLERETGSKQRTLFLWRNEPTVVIGRHQNPYSECDIKYMNDRVVDGDQNSNRKSINLAEITATKQCEIYMHVIYSFNLHKTRFQMIV